jgi:heme exporter protein CcmB
VILAPFFFIFYNLHIAGKAWLLMLVLPLGTWALVGNGVFFAALSMSSRNRELLLSLILFPIFIPALLAMVQATTSIFTGEAIRRCGSRCCSATTSSSRLRACCCSTWRCTPNSNCRVCYRE